MAWSDTVKLTMVALGAYALGATSVGVPWMYAAYASQKEAAEEATAAIPQAAETRERVNESRRTYEQGLADAKVQLSRQSQSGGCPLDDIDREYIGVFKSDAEASNARALSRGNQKTDKVR